MLSKEGEIRRDEACLDYAGSDVILYPCHGSKGNQYWQYDHYTSTLRHGSSRKCLAINRSKDKLLMETCDSGEERQRWKFGSFNPDKAVDGDEDENEVGHVSCNFRTILMRIIYRSEPVLTSEVLHQNHSSSFLHSKTKKTMFVISSSYTV